MALSYSEIRQLYDPLKEAGATTEDLPAFSSRMNELTGTNFYDAGLHDNIIKQASYGIDKLLAATGAPEAGAQIGRQVGGLIGAPEAGEEIGRKGPRTLLNFAPLLIPGGGPVLGAAKLGLAGALSGAETYTETGSPLKGLLSAGTVAVAPKVADIAEQAVLKRLGAPLATAAGDIYRYIGQPGLPGLPAKAAAFGAGQAAAAGLFGASGAGQELLSGEPVSSPFTRENLLNLTLGQAPFALAHLGGKLIAPGPPRADLQKMLDLSAENIQLKAANRALDNTTAIAKPPPPEPPEASYETMKQTRLLLSQVRKEQIRVANDPNLTDEQKIEQQNNLLNQDFALQREKSAHELGDTILGNGILPDEARQELLGKQLFINKNGTYRVIHVADDPSNPEELRGKVIGYSTKDEPAPGYGFQTQETGVARYSLPDEQWRNVKSLDEWAQRYGPVTKETTPELIKGPELTPEQVSAHLHELENIYADTAAANTPADVQSSVVKLRGVEAENDLPETNDVTIAKSANQLVDAGINPDDAVKATVKARTRRVARQIEANAKSLREQEREAPEPTLEELSRLEEQMGKGGFSIQTADKLSHSHADDTIDNQPIKDLVTDQALESARSKAAQDAFNSWEGRNDTTYAKDFNDFVDLVQNYGSLGSVKPDEAAKLLNDRFGTTTWDANEVKDFINRPHVQEWSKGLDEGIARMQTGNAALVPRIVRPAGNRFLFSMAPYDPVTNRLGGKHTLPRDSVVPEATFQKIGGVGVPINKTELALYKQIVPEAFKVPNESEKVKIANKELLPEDVPIRDSVNIRILDEGLKKSGPVVETKTLGESSGVSNEVHRRRNELQHEIETRWGNNVSFSDSGNSVRWEGSGEAPPEFRKLETDFESLPQIPIPTQASYDFIGPKPPEQMPGYVEGLVRLPAKGDIRAGELYRGPHFGSEDRNVLSFYRGYEETLPNGEKAFHVIEVQSDWGQKQRDVWKNVKVEKSEQGFRAVREDDGRPLSDWQPTEKAARMQWASSVGLAQQAEGHPLLNVYNELALKAAIQHAKDIGATKVILSDAETAMMTEGHDRATPRPDYNYTYQGSVEDGLKRIQQTNPNETFRITNGSLEYLDQNGEWGDIGKVVNDRLVMNASAMFANRDTPIPGFVRETLPVPSTIPQEKGMRLNYDQKLPSAMEKLTGEKGEVVDLGKHKAVPERGTYLTDEEAATSPSAGSPVFKDEQGNPKTNITGRSYDISNVPSELTLTEPSRAPRTVGRADAPVWTPNEQRDIDTMQQMGLRQGGQGMLRYLLQSKNPVISSLARDLSKFGDSLNRITGNVFDIESGGYIKPLPNGRSEIRLSPGLLRANDSLREITVAHELVHGLSITELANPTKRPIFDALDNLREQLISKLPQDQQKAVRDAISSGWADRYARGEVSHESLAPGATDAQHQVIYGLLNPEEFVAQGLSSPEMRQFMQGVKVGKESWYNRFVNYVKQLLGIGEGVSGTAFEQFLSHTDQLMERGNHVASFKNFSDRYFENLGMTRDQVSVNTQRATGALLDAGDYPDAMTLLDRVRLGAGVRTPEFEQARRDVNRMIQERGDDAKVTQQVLDEVGIQRVEDYAHELMTGTVPKDSLDVMPEPVVRMAFENAKDANNILSVVKAAVDEKNTGVLNLANPDTLRSTVNDAHDLVQQVLEQNRLHDMQVRDVQGLLGITPDAFANDTIFAAPGRGKELPEWAVDETKKSWLSRINRFIVPINQKVQMLGQTAREAYNRGFQLNENARHMRSESLKVMSMDLKTKQMTKKSAKDFERALSEPRLREAADAWINENQFAGKRTGETRVIDADDPRIVNIIGKLSAQDREIVEEMVNKASISTQHMDDQILEKQLQIASTKGGSLAQKIDGGKLEDQIARAGRLLNAFNADRNDPIAARAADAQIEQVQKEMTPDGFLDLARFTKAASDAWQAQRQFFKSNPAWVSAQRVGKYLVEFNKGGKTIQKGVDSEYEAKQEAGGRPYKLMPNRQTDEDRPPFLGYDAVGIVNKLREFEQTQADIMRNRGFSPDEVNEFLKYSPSNQFATEETYRGGVPGLTPPPRGLTKGAEELPWLRNHFSWVSRTANYWSRQLFRVQAQAHLSDPEIAQDAQLSNDLRTHYDNILQPDSQVGRLAQRTAMTWFMGFNLASVLTDLTQPFFNTAAELTAITGKPFDSYRRVLGSLKDTYATGLGKFDFKDPGVGDMIAKATRDGAVDVSRYDPGAAEQEAIHARYVQILSGGKPQTLGQQFGSAAGMFSQKSMLAFRMAERVNNMSGLIAGYKLYRELEPNLGQNELIEKAKEFNRTVNPPAGPANRPIGLFSGRGAFPRTAAMVAASLQSYNLSTATQLARYIRSGFFRPDGLTPHEIYAARKATVQMLSAQFAAAGVLGLPFASGALAILNQAFPDLELNRKLRETMASIVGGDKENGSILSDIAMTGMPSMTGWDWQSRLSMGNTLPGVSEINGFQPEQLMGAPVNLVSNWIHGGQKLATGNIPQAVDAFMPSALKKIEQLLRSGGQVLDYRNRPIFKPTVGETVGLALGFNPKRLSDFNAASRIASQSDANIKRREGQFHEQMAEEVLAGNFGSVRQALLQRSREDRTYDPVSAVRSIAGAAEELTFPRDLRREGTLRSSDIRGKLLATFNLPSTQPSEVDRLMFRQGVQQRLGLTSTSPTGLQTATLMDQLRAQSPDVSRAELRRQVTLLAHGRRLQTLTSPTE